MHGGLTRIWFSLDSPSQYFPLVYTVLRLERALWGLAPAGYHWVNLLLHAANALLLWRLLARLRLPACWLAAALFALHPVQVESVAWVTELKNVLSLFFCLLAARAWLEFVRRPARPLAMVCGGPPLSGPGADRQNHRLHPARRAFPHPLAAPKTHPPPALPATGPLPRPGHGHGLGHRLVGTLPPIHRRLRLLHRPGRTPPHRQPRRLVLRRQTPLAGSSLLQLPALAHRSRRPACLDLAGGRPRRLRLDLCPAQDRGTRTGNRRALFRGHALAFARLHHGIHFPLHLRGRPLPIRRQHRPARLGRGGSRQSSLPCPSAHSRPPARDLRPAPGAPGPLDLPSMPHLLRQPDSLAGHTAQRSRLLHRPQQPERNPPATRPLRRRHSPRARSPCHRTHRPCRRGQPRLRPAAKGPTRRGHHSLPSGAGLAAQPARCLLRHRPGVFNKGQWTTPSPISKWPCA